jgi:hypothetical protein
VIESHLTVETYMHSKYNRVIHFADNNPLHLMRTKSIS